MCCQHLCVPLCASDSEDDGKLLCTCENNKGTCVNGTCRGDICFYTWVHGREERGCFSRANYREQCFTSFERFFVHCCHENQCNEFITPPPNISQYPKPSLYNILTSHPLILNEHCGTEPQSLVSFQLISQFSAHPAFLCTNESQNFPPDSNWLPLVVSKLILCGFPVLERMMH